MLTLSHAILFLSKDHRLVLLMSHSRWNADVMRRSILSAATETRYFFADETCNGSPFQIWGQRGTTFRFALCATYATLRSVKNAFFLRLYSEVLVSSQPLGGMGEGGGYDINFGTDWFLTLHRSSCTFLALQQAGCGCFITKLNTAYGGGEWCAAEYAYRHNTGGCKRALGVYW